METYFALTIGPIYSTFAQAKKTRAVWAASYFFSWFIKEVLNRTQKEFEILLPYHAKIIDGKYGAGMYADRIYYIKNEQGDAEKLKTCIDAILDDLSRDICLNTVYKDPDTVNKFLKSYLNLHIVEITHDPVQAGEEKNSALKILNDLLDNKELTISYSFDYDDNPLLTYLELETSSQTILVKDAFKGSPGRHFRSIPEISSTSLERYNEKEYKKLVNQSFLTNIKKGNQEFELLDELKSSNAFTGQFRPYHKYYGILYADGDNISELLRKVSGDRNDLLIFSEKLMEFAGLAEEAIYQYGGNGIYLGGEDILAFIPLACKHPQSDELQSVFSLIHDLDVHFKNTLGSYAEKKKVVPPTLSYGLMLSYAKHPLKESILIAHKLLEDAKKHSLKNTIGLRFQKHSGQLMQCFIEKTDQKSLSWNGIQAFTKKYTKNALIVKQQDILGGIIHRFKDDLFCLTFSEAAKGNRLEAFFANFFDEPVHKEISKDNFLRDIRELATSVFADYGFDNPNCRETLFTVLRLVHFINSEKD